MILYTKHLKITQKQAVLNLRSSRSSSDWGSKSNSKNEKWENYKWVNKVAILTENKCISKHDILYVSCKSNSHKNVSIADICLPLIKIYHLSITDYQKYQIFLLIYTPYSRLKNIQSLFSIYDRLGRPSGLLFKIE